MNSIPVTLRSRVESALDDDRQRAAVRNATDLLAERRREALDGLVDADLVRDEAAMIRRRVLANLHEIGETWLTNCIKAGGHVHRARDASDAVGVIRRIVNAHGAHLTIGKGKSMASEEIHLNAALEADGHTVVETDLGEFIIQLAGEPPSHIIAPAIHKSRFDVADLFTADAGRPVEPDISAEASYARERLRDAFLRAGIGITGVNFAIAETGSICLVENEGNGRMCSSLPKVHIAIMGMERIVETWDDLDVMLSVLARSATGQALSVYTNIITGPRRTGEFDGPDELHVIVLDNGRSNLLGTQYEEVLACIRCGACLNVCPVYRHIGGHAYDSVYSGPIGAVLTPLLRPDDEGAAELPYASTLCAACTDVCPVRIPLHDLLLDLRARDQRPSVGFRAWAAVWSKAPAYRISLHLVRFGLRFATLVPKRGKLARWARQRAIPKVRS